MVIRSEDKEVVVNIVNSYFDLISFKSSIKVDGEVMQNGVSECQILNETEKEGMCQVTELQNEIGYQNQLSIKEEPTNKKAFCKWTATESEKKAEMIREFRRQIANLKLSNYWRHNRKGTTFVAPT